MDCTMLMQEKLDEDTPLVFFPASLIGDYCNAPGRSAASASQLRKAFGSFVECWRGWRLLMVNRAPESSLASIRANQDCYQALHLAQKRLRGAAKGEDQRNRIRKERQKDLHLVSISKSRSC